MPDEIGLEVHMHCHEDPAEQTAAQVSYHRPDDEHDDGGLQ